MFTLRFYISICKIQILRLLNEIFFPSLLLKGYLILPTEVGGVLKVRGKANSISKSPAGQCAMMSCKKLVQTGPQRQGK